MDKTQDSQFLNYTELVGQGRKAIEAGSAEYEKAEINPDDPLFFHCHVII
ncbi:MAG: hypothetical protein GX045_03000 [Clostridiaceae bacterium]|jgi:ASC-1-like (ASCH) protein|nr:hypothetical protein [Clostridiaceae bacterium]